MHLFDTHCHLQGPAPGEPLPDALAKARAIGVTRFLCCGTREADWQTVLHLAQGEAGVLPALGLHPWFVREAEANWVDRLEVLLLAHPGAVLGECGLDFATEGARGAKGLDRSLQCEAFRAQWKLAMRLNRPLSLHCREAWGPLLAVAGELGLPAAGAVIHAYSGSVEVAQELQKLGFCLGFGASLTKSSHHRATRAMVSVSDDRLVLETDGAEPAELLRVLEAASRLRGVSPARLAEQVWNNSLRMFGASDLGFRGEGQAQSEA